MQAEFRESKITGSIDREWDLWRKFLIAANENWSKGVKKGQKLSVETLNENSEIEDWEWHSWIFKNEGMIKNEILDDS